MKRSRLFTAGLVGALLLAPLAACGSGSGGDRVDQTDGIDIELPEGGPQRIVAQSTAAAALTQLGLGDRIVGTFGPLLNGEGEPDSQVAGLDVESVTDVTGAGDYGDIDEEKVAELDPDIIVTSAYLEDQYWYMSDAVHDKLGKRWDIAVVDYAGEDLIGMLDNMEQMASDLGADLDSDQVQAGRDAFQSASDQGAQLAAQLTASGRTILAASGLTDAFYVSNPAVSQDLNYWQATLGFPIVVPDNPDPQGYFETLSWEESDKYDGDLVLWDDRIGQAGLDLMKSQPVFSTITAVQNDAFTPWSSVFPPTYQTAADLLNRFIADVAPIV